VTETNASKALAPEKDRLEKPEQAIPPTPLSGPSLPGSRHWTLGSQAPKAPARRLGRGADDAVAGAGTATVLTLACFTGIIRGFGAKAIEKQHRINEQIRISPVRVIGSDGSQLGIIPTDQALGVARDEGLDLVEVAPGEQPPVCRIMDFGKFKYQQKKKQHKTHVHHTKIKEIRLRPKTGEHDIDFKVNQAKTFLLHKDKVVVSVVFRGRELAHIDEGQRVMKTIIQQLEEVCKVESGPQQMGRRLVCTLSPK
jgi:translation initiation factor IF-3